MKFIDSLIMLGCGIVAGVALVLSCGGSSSPKDADAADAPTCNCSAAEPPIPSRITEVKSDDVIPKDTSRVHVGMPCPVAPQHAIPLSGGCIIDYPSQITGNVILEESAPDANGWRCTWSNLSNLDVPVHVIVRCLVPQ